MQKLDSSPDVANAEAMYDCASDPARALEVAQTLVDTWDIAEEMVTGRGGKFTAVLQPVAHYGNANFSYLNLTAPTDLALAAQYKAVYPLIIEIAKERNLDFSDFTSIYDGCSECYTDFCHVGPQAHRILVTHLSEILNITANENKS
jgi:hypothetical protein